MTTGSSHENRDNLDPSFFEVLRHYEGTELGRQEIYGELLDPAESGILKRVWFQQWQEYDLPHIKRLYISYDTAMKAEANSDYSAGQVWGLFNKETWDEAGVMHIRPSLLLLHAWRKKLTYPELKEHILDDYEIWTKRYGTEPDAIIIEDKGSGISLIQDLGEAGINAFPYNPGRENKLMRAHVVSDILHDGLVWVLPRRNKAARARDTNIFNPEIESFLSEVGSFTGNVADKDDQVDAAVQCWQYARETGDLELTTDYRPIGNKPRGK